MPYPIVTVPQYPDVPAGIPGVPAALINPNPSAVYALSGGIGGLPPSLSVFITSAGRLSQAPVNLPGIKNAVQWGIFYPDGITPALSPDSIVSVELRTDRRISDYPQEQGAFASYNKVYVPYSARVRMTKAGSVAARSQFLAALESIKNDTNLYTLVIPEITYRSCNVVHYDFLRRAQTGANMLIVDVWVEEVSESLTQTFTNTAAPSGASQQSIGPVQAQAATSAQLNTIGTPAVPGNSGNWLAQQFPQYATF